MKRGGILTCILLACILAGSSVHAETTDEARMRELQAQIDALEQQAAAKRAIIATTQQQAASLKNEISILQNQIAAVQAQIGAINATIEKTGLEIADVQDQIGEKRAEITKKRDTIGRMIFFLDKKDQEHILESLFKYATLSDFLSQLHDIAAMQGKLLSVIADIRAVKAALEQDKTELEQKQQQLEQLNAAADQRRQQLAGVKVERSRVLTATKGQEALYQQQLTAIEEQKAEFFKQLREIELKVISGGLYIVHITADSMPSKAKLFTPPEDTVRITQGYGCTKYARCGNSRGPYGGAPHNGIDYAAGFGAPIKAIGPGQIVANGLNDGWGNWVAIQHLNNMVSVYAHMSSLSALRVGAQVTAGQVIGYEGKTGKVTGSHVHLSLYKEFFTYIKDSNGQLYFNYFDGSVNPSNYMK